MTLLNFKDMTKARRHTASAKSLTILFGYKQAFTLVELAVVLVLAGLIAGFAMNAFNSSGRTECYVTTKAQLEKVREAMERYALKYDRFPMPARRTVGVEDPQYGREIDGAIPAQVAELDSRAGAIFGAIPFQTLGISAQDAADCWGNKYTYAVTIELTEQAKFVIPSTDGKLDIKTASGSTFLAGAGYAIISHGADELGAVQANYSDTTPPIDKKWCTLVAGQESKTENCEVSNVTLITGEFNDGKNAGAAFYDDIIVFRGKPWRIGLQNPCTCSGPGPTDVFSASPQHLWSASPTCN